MNFCVQLEPAKYSKGIQWIRELLYETELTPERLKIIGAKMINDVAQVKRKGNKVVGDLMKGLIYNKGEKLSRLYRMSFFHSFFNATFRQFRVQK